MKASIFKIGLKRLLCCALGVSVKLADAESVQNIHQQVLAPGYSTLQFTAPDPGSYDLPKLGSAADGAVIDSDGTAINLHELMGDKVVLLSFIYSTCSDVNGCPLATGVFHRVKRRLNEEPELSKELRLITLSFNPEHDTPEMMRKYARPFQSAGVEWRFLTTKSEQVLQPILESYHQSVQKDYDRQGGFLGTFSHLLRVYLIDRNKRLRNIYSVSFLHPDTLINDIKTLLQEQSHLAWSAATAVKKIERQSGSLEVDSQYTAGDNRAGYEQADYETRSIALTDRIGQAANLIQYVSSPPLGLPTVPVPSNNPISKEKISLGRKLFYDRRLSFNNTFSCAMCHIPEQGFTSNEMKTAVGIEGRTVRRNAPTLYNVAYLDTLFHDGRENTLEQQVWGPLLARNEMANPSIGYVVETINNSPDYNGLFEAVFGRGPSMEAIGMAIASYERTLNSGNSPFDRWYFGKQNHAMSEVAKRGFALFTGKAGCNTCHTIATGYALFADNKLHNTGIGYERSMKTEFADKRIQVAPGIFLDIEAAAIESVSESKPNDLGRYEVTQNPEDRWKYTTPSLRNVELTSPYMHNGSLPTLKEVVEFYNRGGVPNKNLDPLIKPLKLSDGEVNDLVIFLHALTGANSDQLVSDAFAAPIGEPH